MFKYQRTLFIYVCLFLTNATYADTIDINATASGWVQPNGQTNGTSESSTNFIVGRQGGGNDLPFFNYFVFDLSGLDNEIESASLKLENPDNGFFSFDNDFFGTTTCCPYSVSSPLSGTISPINLLPENFSFSTTIAVSNALNSSTSVNYGNVQINESSNGMTVEIILNEVAISDINEVINQNNESAYFAIGGRLDAPNSREAFAFGNSGLNQFDRILSLKTKDINVEFVSPAVLLFLLGNE